MNRPAVPVQFEQSMELDAIISAHIPCTPLRPHVLRVRTDSGIFAIRNANTLLSMRLQMVVDDGDHTGYVDLDPEASDEAIEAIRRAFEA